MFKGIAASSVVIVVFFSVNGCKNNADTSENAEKTKPVVAEPPAPASSKVSEDKVAASDVPPVVVSASKNEATPDVPTQIRDETAKNVMPASTSAEISSENADGAALTATEGVQLAELIVARGIEAKKPLDPGNSYTLGEFERIVAFMSVLNPSETEDELQVSFLDTSDGRERGKVTVRVGAQKKWRTWAFTKTINKAGKWEILVRNKDGLIIGRAPFEILSAS